MGVEDGAHDPEEHTHQEDTDEQGLASTESLYSDSDKDRGGDNLDDSVDSTRQETGPRAFQTNRLEDDWSVVRDRVLSAPLLESKDHKAVVN